MIAIYLIRNHVPLRPAVIGVIIGSTRDGSAHPPAPMKLKKYLNHCFFR